MNTSDATATADKILQGYTAYANGNKIYGTYVGSGSPGGGVILGEDEVVAEKVYGNSNVLVSNGPLTNNLIPLNGQQVSRKIGLVNTETKGSYVIADRKLTENVDGEIIIYNIVSNATNCAVQHNDYNSKYSYTYSELGIEGTVNCIAASPLLDNNKYCQITIGTSTAIYTYLFNVDGNNGNGSIGDIDGSYHSTSNKVIINEPCASYNDIVYSNTDKNVFAYFSNNKINIVYISWFFDVGYTKYTSVNAMTNNVLAQFRFSKNDRFLTYIEWGTRNNTEVCVMLLNEFYYIVQQKISETGGSSNWNHGQILINSEENFMIFNGKPFTISYNLEEETIEYSKLSDTQVIPFNNNVNEFCYSTFSKDDKYIYAIEGSGTGTMYKIANYKVDYINLNSQWEKISNSYDISENAYIPVIDIINSKGICFSPNDGTEGFYYFRADSSIKEVIGLNYNGEFYQKV